jgi:hypothetical protein
LVARYPGFYLTLVRETFIHLSREPDRRYLGYPVLFRVAAEVEFLGSNDVTVRELFSLLRLEA